MELTDRFERALRYAFRVHRCQVRKGSGVPYVAHLLAVAALVLEFGGSEDEAIAALLHDAAEDAGGRERLDDIRREFGDHVARLVEGCSDTLQQPKPPWRERKESYLRRLRSEPASVQLVCCCDKLHNARTSLRELSRVGESFWQRFRGGKEGTLWYYRQLLATFDRDKLPPALLDELRWAVSELHRLAGVETDEPAGP